MVARDDLLHRACPPRLLHLSSFHPPAPTQLDTLSLHDALPICAANTPMPFSMQTMPLPASTTWTISPRVMVRVKSASDRKSTRLNSSHSQISYAVFCLKKKSVNDNHHHATRDLSTPTDTHSPQH